MTGNSQELKKLLRSRCSKNHTSRILYQEALDLKTKQMADADNNCRGWAALKTGLFPLIKCPLQYLNQKTVVQLEKQFTLVDQR